MSSLRREVTEQLEAAAKALPATKRWRVITGQAVPPSPRYPVVLVTLRAWEPHPGAPRLYWVSELVATLFVPNLEPSAMADSFEENGEILTELVDGLTYPGLIWTRAERVTYDDRPALDVILTITNGKVSI